MLNLVDSVRAQCEDLEPALVETHFRRLPTSYFERYSTAEVARHLHLLAALTGPHPVEVEIQPLAAQVFEVVVVGEDHAGTVACITAALAAYGFDLEDVQVSSYLDPEPWPDRNIEPTYFVIVLRISGSLRGRSLTDMTGGLRDRLRLAFGHLAQGHLLEAQTVAADTRITHADTGQAGTDRHPSASAGRATGFDGMILGGDFRIERKLATGGMSEVYLATQMSLNRTVALKVFRHEGTGGDEVLARLNQEALVLAQFSCGQIVQILAAGTTADDSGRAVGWMAMEYMAGGDLGRWLQQQEPPSPELGLRWFRQALKGLHYAHRRAVLHHDLKPHNLLLSAEGHLKVSDFGLLRQATQLTMDPAARTTLAGTPHYMSPEQAMGDSLDERSDIFSLGTTFFYLLSGRLPFQGSTVAAILMQIAQQDAPRLRDIAPHVPIPLAVIIGRMMARPREERYQDVGVILEDLASYERRGLLNSSSGGTFVAVPPSSPLDRPDVETQAYEPAEDNFTE
jgi:Protein kinase domain